MKNINYLNYFFVGIPILLCLVGLMDETYLFFGLLFTMLTGLFQVVIGIKMLKDEPNNIYLKIYTLTVILFFATFFIISKISLSNWTNYILIPIPLILAIYLSIIIYKKSKV